MNSGHIELRVDDRPHSVANGTTLAELVAQLGHEAQAVTTAVNGSFVPRGERDRALNVGDAVLIFKPIVGG